MIEKAVLERFDGTYAVLFFEKNFRRLNVPVQLVPKGAAEGSRLKVEFDGNELVKILIDHQRERKE